MTNTPIADAPMLPPVPAVSTTVRCVSCNMLLATAYPNDIAMTAPDTHLADDGDAIPRAPRQADGAPEGDVLIRATQAEIANLAGTSRESASRFLATLERAGVVTLGRGKVTVHDPGRLRNYIH